MVAKDILPLLPPHLLMLMLYQAWHESTTSQNRDLCINEPSIRSCLDQHLGSLARYTTVRSLHWYVYQEVGQRVKFFPYPNACLILRARLAWEKKKISQHEARRFRQSRWESGSWPSLPIGGEPGAHDKNQGGGLKGEEEKEHAGRERIEKEKGDARSRYWFILPSCSSNQVRCSGLLSAVISVADSRLVVK